MAHASGKGRATPRFYVPWVGQAAGAVLVALALFGGTPSGAEGPTYSLGPNVRLTADPSWSEADLAEFVETSEAMSLAAGDVLRAAGWQGNWDVGKRSFEGMNPAFLELGTKAGFQHPDFTGGRQTTVFVRVMLAHSPSEAGQMAENLIRHYEGLLSQPDKYVTYDLAENRGLGLGSKSRLFVIGVTTRIGSAKPTKRTRAAAFFTSDRWVVSIEEATDPDAVEAAARALADGLAAAQSDDVSQPRSDPADGISIADRLADDDVRIDAADGLDEPGLSEGTGSGQDGMSVADRLADPAEAEMEDFETFFYRVEIPQDRELLVMDEPRLDALEVIHLLPDATDLRVREVRQVDGTLWADLCAGNHCGWVVARFLRRQAPMSPEASRTVEVAYPEVNVFMDATVNSPMLGHVNEGQRFQPDLISTDENGGSWIRICGDGWCGWAAAEFFVMPR